MGSSVVPVCATLLILLTVTGGVNPAAGQPPPVNATTLHDIAATLEMYVDELPRIPKLLGYVTSGFGVPGPGSLTIGMYQTTWKFHRDLPATTVFAYGTSTASATVPGPIIEAIRGVPTAVTWENFLPADHILPWDPTIATAIPRKGGVPTVVHLHGGIHPPETDGHPLTWFTGSFRETGSKWSQPTYTYPNIQGPGNLWYHDHALGLTRVNLLAGLFAPYVIKDPVSEAALNLPPGPDFDQHLVIFDRSFYKDGSLYINYTGNNPTIHPQWQLEYLGDAVIVNGKAWPYLEVQRRKYRFRIINASNARYFRLSLTNGLSFTVIGSDASYLPAPVSSPNVILSPSEIADVVVDFSIANGDESILTNDAPAPYPIGNPVDGLNGKIMKFVIEPGNPVPPDTSTIPERIISYAPVDEAVTNRYIVLYEYQSSTGDPAHLYINGKDFMDPVTETPKPGSTEVWEVINLTKANHPLHIHLAKFQALKIQELVDLEGFKSCMMSQNNAVACNVTSHVTGNLLTVPEYEKTWKNVVKIEPGYQTTVVVRFNLVANDGLYPFDVTAEPGYVYHCHVSFMFFVSLFF
ncbi:OLC1v1021452C2 [Oldenlandia corymbosa var. corymbosa]|uniref:OLC1v1021452C2 n=1 Tax=Oldenlandia corymbosa var. corymbosa TaxID=529605 RepID=A0AAV1BVY3_OLDCO|nr:OLC1v1021452C2 [Oldenlandia corymbosa var. corymbosa]